jgi:hypothetical protein
MSDDQHEQIQAELTKTTEQLKDTRQYIKEIQIQHSIDALILAGLVAVVFQTFSYLIYGTILTDLDTILYMFSLLIGPSAFFLLLLHLYELYGVVKRGEKSIPLTLDLMYFIYLIIAFATMIGLNSYYQQHGITPKFLTSGWNLAVALLCVEVLIALLIAKYIVTIFITKKLPHFFEHPPKERRTKQLPVQRLVIKPKQIYYFREKPDVTLWQNEESFVRYKR